MVRRIAALPRGLVLWASAVCIVFVAAGAFALHEWPNGKNHPTDISSQSKRASGRYRPTQLEWASLVVETVEQRSFRLEHVTEGKIAVDEDRSTPIFSPYAGRVTKLIVKPGDIVERGQ